MKFTKLGKNDCLTGWRFNGKCMDIKSRKVYMFCTLSIYEFNQFKNKGEMLGMRFIEGKYNPNYEVVRRLLKK